MANCVHVKADVVQSQRQQQVCRNGGNKKGPIESKRLPHLQFFCNYNKMQYVIWSKKHIVLQNGHELCKTVGSNV